MTHTTMNEARKEYFRIADAIDAPYKEGAAERIATIRRAAMRLDWIGIRECNGVTGLDGFAKWDDDDQAKADRHRQLAEQRAKNAFAEAFNMTRLAIEFQGDPRGPSIIVWDSADTGRRLATFW